MSRSRTLVTAVLIGLSAAAARGDVGVMQINKANQQLRSGDRFSIGVHFRQPSDQLARVNLYIKKQEHERLLGASLTLTQSGRTLAYVPVHVRPLKNGSGHTVSLTLSRDLLGESRLEIGIDRNEPGRPLVGTSYWIELGSYAPAAEVPAADTQ